MGDKKIPKKKPATLESLAVQLDLLQSHVNSLSTSLGGKITNLNKLMGSHFDETQKFIRKENTELNLSFIERLTVYETHPLLKSMRGPAMGGPTANAAHVDTCEKIVQQPKFKVGDIVQRHCGGPEMKVDCARDVSVRCRWADETSPVFQTEWFYHKFLRMVKPAPRENPPAPPADEPRKSVKPFEFKEGDIVRHRESDKILYVSYAMSNGRVRTYDTPNPYCMIVLHDKGIDPSDLILLERIRPQIPAKKKWWQLG